MRVVEAQRRRRCRLASILCLLGALTAPWTAACQIQAAAEEMKAGGKAYQESNYAEAESHFRKAVQLDPDSQLAHLSLAKTLAIEFLPGSQNPENEQLAEAAIEQYKIILQGPVDDQTSADSTHAIAALYYNMKHFDEALDYYAKAIEIDPKNAELYYSIAVIDWMKAYEATMKARAASKVNPVDMIGDVNVCVALRQTNQAEVENGIQMLKKAIELRPDYDDAMAYANMLYRQRAEYECDDKAMRAEDLKTADAWVDKTMAVKQAKAGQ